MTKFDERLAAAKASPKPFRDVEILLDTDLSQKREELREALKAAKERAAYDQRLTAVDEESPAIQEKLDALIAESADSLITLRFFRLPGDAWANIAAHCPARLGVQLEREQYGYNMQEASKLAAAFVDSNGKRYGGRLDGGELIPLLYVPAAGGTPALDQWADLFEAIDGSGQSRIESAIWELNVWEPDSQVGQLKNELATRPA